MQHTLCYYFSYATFLRKHPSLIAIVVDVSLQHITLADLVTRYRMMHVCVHVIACMVHLKFVNVCVPYLKRSSSLADGLASVI